MPFATGYVHSPHPGIRTSWERLASIGIGTRALRPWSELGGHRRRTVTDRHRRRPRLGRAEPARREPPCTHAHNRQQSGGRRGSSALLSTPHLSLSRGREQASSSAHSISACARAPARLIGRTTPPGSSKAGVCIPQPRAARQDRSPPLLPWLLLLPTANCAWSRVPYSQRTWSGRPEGRERTSAACCMPDEHAMGSTGALAAAWRLIGKAHLIPEDRSVACVMDRPGVRHGGTSARARGTSRALTSLIRPRRNHAC
jgi:hypothetical protein